MNEIQSEYYKNDFKVTLFKDGGIELWDAATGTEAFCQHVDDLHVLARRIQSIAANLTNQMGLSQYARPKAGSDDLARDPNMTLFPVLRVS